MTATKHLVLLTLGLGLLAGSQAMAADPRDGHAAHHPQPAMPAADSRATERESAPQDDTPHHEHHEHHEHAASVHRHSGQPHHHAPHAARHAASATHAGHRHAHSMTAGPDTAGPAAHHHDAPVPTTHDHHATAEPHSHAPTAAPDHHAPHRHAHNPVPALTDADRAAAFPDLPEHRHTHAAPAAPSDAERLAAFPRLPPHAMHAGGINSFVLVDKLEWQDADAGSALAWDVTSWIGGDIDRLQIRSEGTRLNGRSEDAELQVLWGHAIGPWWETVLGVRQDFKPGVPQSWAAFGIQGTPLFGLETEATAYLGEGGQSAARLQAEYDLLITNRLILQPRAEANFYGRNDPQRGVGAGLADSQFGLRLRYEIRRELAPYIGVNWSHAYGNSATALRGDGEPTSEARLVAGIRAWF